MKNLIVKSFLANHLTEFLEVKYALGYKYQNGTSQIKQLDKLCAENYAGCMELTKDIVSAWIEKRPNESAATQNRRIRLARELGLFLAKCGKNPYILPQYKIIDDNSFVPYVFSHEEVERFFNTIDSQPPHVAYPICNIMYSVLFRILYCCGLRISEALSLKYGDIDLERSVLIVKKSKFSKDRLVPMSASLQAAVEQYIPKVKQHYPINEHIFPSRFSEESIRARVVYSYFRKILWESGIPHGGKGKGPRLHDFRHTFSVHALQKWVDDKVDVYTALPILSTYLGHENIRTTGLYLRLTAEVYPDILAITEAFSGEIIPEVTL
jgi:integrase